MADQKQVALLLEGVERWNEWRKTEPQVIPDLSGIELEGLHLNKANFQHVNFRGAIFRGVRLDFADFRGSDLRDCTWEKVRAIGADFSEADFSGSTLSFCDLSMARLEGIRFSGTTLVSCDLTDARPLEIDFYGATLKGMDPGKGIPGIQLGVEDRLEETRGGGDMRGYLDRGGDIQLADEGPAAAPQPVLAAKPGDTVACSVYAPESAAPAEPVQVQVWLHGLEETDAVGQLAVSIDDTAVLRQFSHLGVPVSRGERLRLVLFQRGQEDRAQTRETSWEGSKTSQQFVVDMPDDLSKGKVFFTLRVFLQREDWLPIGEIVFFIKVASESESGVVQPQGSMSRRYHYAFVSYSSKDRQEVLRRVQMLKIFDQKFFMDVLSLQPGEEWGPALEQHIRDCDLFLLFWSTNARNSEWVLKEVKFALARKNGQREAPPMIQPIPLELPVVPPPLELGHLHVNDSILYLIEPES